METVGACVPRELQPRGRGRKEGEVEGEPEAQAGSRWRTLRQRFPGGKGNWGRWTQFGPGTGEEVAGAPEVWAMMRQVWEVPCGLPRQGV